MQHYIYPAVFIYNEIDDNYIVAFEDLNLFTEGDTIEDAYNSAKEFLLSYCVVAEKLEEELIVPPPFNTVKQNHPNDLVLLVDVNY